MSSRTAMIRQFQSFELASDVPANTENLAAAQGAVMKEFYAACFEEDKRLHGEKYAREERILERELLAHDPALTDADIDYIMPLEG